MRKLIVGAVMAAVSMVGVSPAFAAEHHPPKFGVHSNQCDGGSNQPNCPGNH